MKYNERQKQIMNSPKHQWIKIGNGYSKCSSCGLIKFERTKATREYMRDNNIVENTGCKIK